jgi:hypothetical protein
MLRFANRPIFGPTTTYRGAPENTNNWHVAGTYGRFFIYI